jgi:hypothetical protein
VGEPRGTQRPRQPRGSGGVALAHPRALFTRRIARVCLSWYTPRVSDPIMIIDMPGVVGGFVRAFLFLQFLAHTRMQAGRCRRIK